MWWFVLYVGSIAFANYMIANIGQCVAPGGPCLIPVWPGLMATSGTLMIGLSFTFRDMMQNSIGKRWTFIGIFAGVIISIFLSDPRVAFASGFTLLLSETADFLVYTPLKEKGLILAIFASNIAGLLLDTLVFILLAFGPERLNLFVGQAVGKFEMTIVAIVIISILRRNNKYIVCEKVV